MYSYNTMQSLHVGDDHLKVSLYGFDKYDAAPKQAAW